MHPFHNTPVIHTCGKVCAQYPPSTLCAVHNIHRMHYLPPFAPPPEENSQQKAKPAKVLPAGRNILPAY